jgi:two-component system, chemotaxis family, chemotaxis protein CheY
VNAYGIMRIMQKDMPTIMVVEDETLLLQAITKKLKLTGLDVVSCASGQQALDYLNNMENLPDSIWLDYYLKDMNGLAFMQAVKENPKWAHIPVVVVSNSASPEKVKNMLALGAKKYILKAEFRLDEIIEMMRELITEAHGTTTRGAVTPHGTGPTPPANPPAASADPA